MSNFFYLVCFSCCCSFLFAQSTSAAASGITAYETLFPIDVGQRGSDLINMYAKLNQTAPYSTSFSTVAIQTSTQGLIQNVKKIIPATNNTILVVNYLKQNQTTQSTIIVFVENINEMIYSTSQLNSTATYSSSPTTNILPYFSVNPSQRATDILYLLNSQILPVIQRIPSASVSIQTSLSGSYSSLINNTSQTLFFIQSPVSNIGTLLLIPYRQSSNLPTSYIVVPSDEIVAINYNGPALGT